MIDGSRSLWKSTCWRGALLAAAVLAGSVCGAPALAAGEDDDEGSLYVRTFEIGAAFGRYPDADENSNGQFFKLVWDKPREHFFRINGGRQARFDETTVGVGTAYGHHFPNKTTLTVGASASTGELAPEWSGSVSVRRPFSDVGFTLGYVHDEWENGASNDRFSLGAQKWFRHVILGAAGRYNLSHPGSQDGWAGNVNVTYYRWKALYVGAGYNFGQVRYVPVGFEDVLVEYDTEGYYLTLSRWFQSKSGINVRVGRAETPENYGIRASWFTEW